MEKNIYEKMEYRGFYTHNIIHKMVEDLIESWDMLRSMKNGVIAYDADLKVSLEYRIKFISEILTS